MGSYLCHVPNLVVGGYLLICLENPITILKSTDLLVLKIENITSIPINSTSQSQRNVKCRYHDPDSILQISISTNRNGH